jgi:hypothetical protein
MPGASLKVLVVVRTCKAETLDEKFPRVPTLLNVCVENLTGRMRSHLSKTLTLYEARRFAVNNFFRRRARPAFA